LALCEAEGFSFKCDGFTNLRHQLGVHLVGARARLSPGLLSGRTVKKPVRFADIVNAPDIFC
jgi:hypothetical protein